FGYMGAQIVAKESILAEGVTVKLALAPIDPRSLMQGDYVSLNYDISTAPDHLADRIQEMPANSRVRVVLRMGQDGVVEFDRILEKNEVSSEGEVVINGRTDGWRNIYYGIESYFVPEGDGPKFERSAHFASVRIGKNGDALLEHLLEQ